MNAYDKVLDAVKTFKVAVTAPLIHNETSPKLDYATVYRILNELVRSGKIEEGKNEIGKRVFQCKKP